MAAVHAVAKDGFGSGTNELYDRARPSYPSGSLAHIRSSLKSQSPLNIVELGAGTGIFTRALLAHPDWSSSVRELRAIEPSSGMRDVFQTTTKDPRVAASEGTFDKTNVPDGWADIVVIAQAFHWCPDYNAAAAEFARVLKPDGIVVFIWNLEDRDRATWVAQLRDRIEVHEQETPQFRLGLWRQVFGTESYQKFFKSPEEHTVEYALPGSLDIVVDRAHSKSYIAVLSTDDKAKVTADVTEIVMNADKVWIDKERGMFEYPYKTLVVVASKKEALAM